MAEARAQNSYKVTERLESGGMAEVFRGESMSVAGFKKQVAIKRVLPHLASNEKFIRMFLDEARLSARLTHTNIVQVFDIGHVDNTYFIVTEFIDGINLKGVIEYLRAHQKPFPIPLACHIAMKICEGLNYAHELTDNDGNLLNIVHRDISPPNVLISKRGEVKIVDFGLAKAAHSVEKTEPGVVKGKFSYLSPETALGHEADAQADIFAVGIMLWEMLAGRKLFQGESDYQTVKLVQQAVVPSIRTIHAAVPEELERILKQSLARSKTERFTSAQVMAEELSNFLFAHKLKVSAADLAKLVHEVVVERVEKARQNGKQNSVIESLIQEEMIRLTSLGDPHSPSPDGSLGGGSNPMAEGAQPLDALHFENVNEWASGLMTESIAPGSLLADASASMGVKPASPTPRNLADELEGDAEDPTIVAPPSHEFDEVRNAPPPAATASDTSYIANGRNLQTLQNPPPAEGGSKTTVMIAAVAVIAVIVVVVGLYFTGAIGR